MRLFLKILKITGIGLGTIIIILFSASLLLQDKITMLFIKSLNNSVPTKIEIGSVKLSFIRKFPKASLELKNVLIHSSKGFSASSFQNINTDTLFSSESLSAEFEITDLINGIYKIEQIRAKEGRLNLYSDKNGKVNYDITFKNDISSGNELTIDLDKINLTDIDINYNNLATEFAINGRIINTKLKSKISEKEVEFYASGNIKINKYLLFNTLLTEPVSANLDLSLVSSKEGIRFKKGEIQAESVLLGLKGLISSENYLDINLSGHNIDLVKIKKYLPEKILEKINPYNPSGLLDVESQIKGKITRTSTPEINLGFSFKKGHFNNGKSIVSFNNVSFNGTFSNRSEAGPDIASVNIKNFKATLGSAEYSGEIKITGYSNPDIDLLLNGEIVPSELIDFLNITDVKSSSGSIDMNLKLKFNFDINKKYSLSEIVNLHPAVNLLFKDFSIVFQNKGSDIFNIDGPLLISETVKAENLKLSYLNQNFIVACDFTNLPEWLSGQPVVMSVSGAVKSDFFDPELFTLLDKKTDSISHNLMAFNMPEDINLNITFDISRFKYKKFSSTNNTGQLTYKLGLLTFKSLKMEALNGVISGNCFLVQNNKKGNTAKGDFNLTDLDINKAFTTFNNFGQDFIKAENLKGTLSGSVSVLIPMDSMLNPNVKLLSAEGKYIISDGSLVNFDPVKELSSFIEVSELKNISFETLENDFFIRNNFFYVPQMDVKSSAADLTVNGKHSFNNDYEYHVKILLSELLSKKRKKNKSGSSEFGVVEDDGLGRTSMLLKVINKGEDINVSYDLKAAGTQVKNNIKAERQNLKTILNQEYGWFKEDTISKSAPAKPTGKKQRFRISWNESDSITDQNEQQASKKENSIKNVFKKKEN
jgi:hypothetical protein